MPPIEAVKNFRSLADLNGILDGLEQGKPTVGVLGEPGANWVLNF